MVRWVDVDDEHSGEWAEMHPFVASTRFALAIAVALMYELPSRMTRRLVNGCILYDSRPGKNSRSSFGDCATCSGAGEADVNGINRSSDTSMGVFKTIEQHKRWW